MRDQFTQRRVIQPSVALARAPHPQRANAGMQPQAKVDAKRADTVPRHRATHPAPSDAVPRPPPEAGRPARAEWEDQEGARSHESCFVIGPVDGRLRAIYVPRRTSSNADPTSAAYQTV